MSEQKTSLFDKLYAAKEEVLKGLRKPLVKNKAKRKYYAARDNALEQKADAEDALHKAYENVSDLNIQQIIDQEAIIASANQTISTIEKSFETMFGETMTKVEELESED